jgi:pimeloyl-ACP methyl ester carboxylesterase
MSANIQSGQTIRLRDGRALGYSSWGDPDGAPVVCLHGCPGSRFNAWSFHTPAREAGIRVIAPERPGYGLSSPSATRLLTDWPSDLEHLADALGLEKFHLAGASGGGPHALVCGARIPHRLRSLTVVSSLAPLDVPNSTDGMDAALRRLWTSGPTIQRLMIRALALGSRWAPDSALIPTRDEHAMKFFGPGEIREAFLADMREALRDGGRAMAAEVAMLSKPWGFELKEIEVPVRLWHGALDANCPASMAEYLIATIPNVEATIFPGEGHMCAFERLAAFFSPFGTAA